MVEMKSKKLTFGNFPGESPMQQQGGSVHELGIQIAYQDYDYKDVLCL